MVVDYHEPEQTVQTVMFILLVLSVEPDTREVAAYENRRASRLELVERSPRFASTGRRLKNDCHLSGSERGKASEEENVGTSCRGRGEKEEEKKKKKKGRWDTERWGGNDDLEEKTNNLPRRYDERWKVRTPLELFY